MAEEIDTQSQSKKNTCEKTIEKCTAVFHLLYPHGHNHTFIIFLAIKERGAHGIFKLHSYLFRINGIQCIKYVPCIKSYVELFSFKIYTDFLLCVTYLGFFG